MAYIDSQDRSGGVRIVYPKTRKVDQVDDYHGVTVADPYRWLEDDNAPETLEWVKEQNEITTAYLDAIPHREPILARLRELWNYPRRSPPSRRGDRYFFQRNDGLQNQQVLCVQTSLDTEPRILLDPNDLSADGTTALVSHAVSHDGSLLAYGLSHAGSDWVEYRVRDVESGEDLPDHIRWVKFSYTEWTKDGRGFFYSRYPEPTDGGEFSRANRNHSLYYHRLGTSQEDDILIHERPDHPDWFVVSELTKDGRYLLITLARSSSQNRLYVVDLIDPLAPNLTGPAVPIVDEWNGYYHLVANDGPLLYILTNNGAARGRIIVVDAEHPGEENRRTLISESEDVISAATVAGDRFVVTYMHNAYSRVAFFSMRGEWLGDLDLPTIGTVVMGSGNRDDSEIFYVFTSYLYPISIYRCNLSTGASELYWEPEIKVDPDGYVSRQLWYTSRDGTRVPMFVTHRRDLEMNGDNPTLLYGYGGFNVPLTPMFQVGDLLWVENGGIHAVVCLRGGGEFGEEWYRAGTLERKENVFDDFIGAAEYLIAEGYTSPPRLAMTGRSNGGLLVGAVMCRRPDLFAAANPGVGVLDMLRYHRFTIGIGWRGDYGISDDEAQFRTLYGYSPLHNLAEGTSYPATLVTTGDHDDRVVPAHSFKFAARLQECHEGEAPVLIRVTTNAGHGMGKPTSLLIEEEAEVRAFLMSRLGMQVPG